MKAVTCQPAPTSESGRAKLDTFHVERFDGIRSVPSPRESVFLYAGQSAQHLIGTEGDSRFSSQPVPRGTLSRLLPRGVLVQVPPWFAEPTWNNLRSNCEQAFEPRFPAPAQIDGSAGLRLLLHEFKGEAMQFGKCSTWNTQLRKLLGLHLQAMN